MSSAKRARSEGVPAVTLRADNPVHARSEGVPAVTLRADNPVHARSEGVPAVTLRADNPVHVKALLFAQEGFDRGMGTGTGFAVELRRITREFVAFGSHEGLTQSCYMAAGPQFRLFLSRKR